MGARSLINTLWTEKKRQGVETKKIEKKEIGTFGDTIVTEFGQTYNQPLSGDLSLETASIGEIIQYMETNDLQLDPVISAKMMQIFPAFTTRIDNFEITGMQAASIKKLNSTIFNLSLKENTIQNSHTATANQKILDFLNKIKTQFDASAQKLETVEFKQNTKNEAEKGWQVRMGLGLAAGAGAFGLGYVARKYAPDAINWAMETISGKSGQVKIGDVVGVSSHAPAPAGQIAIKQVGDLIFYGKPGVAVPTDEQITNAISEQALNLPIDGNNTVKPFGNLEGVYAIKPDSINNENDLKFTENHWFTEHNRIITKGDSGEVYGIDANRDGIIEANERFSIIGRYKATNDLVVSSPNASPEVIAEVNRRIVAGEIEPYFAPSSNSTFTPTPSVFGQQTVAIPFGTSVNPGENLSSVFLSDPQPLTSGTNVSTPKGLNQLGNDVGNNAATNTPLPGSDLGIKNDLTFGDGIINSNDREHAKFKIGVELDSLSRQLANLSKLNDPNFNQLGVMAKVTQLSSLKQELENLKPGQTIKLNDDLNYNLVNKDGTVQLDSNIANKIKAITDPKKFGLDDNIVSKAEGSDGEKLDKIQEQIKNSVAELNKLKTDNPNNTELAKIADQRIAELNRLGGKIANNDQVTITQGADGELSFKGSDVVETPASQVPKIPKESNLPETTDNPEPEVVNGVTDPGSNLPGGKFERLISNDPELQKILKDGIQKGEIGDLITCLKKLAGTNREMIDAVNKINKKLEIYFYDAKNAGKSVKFDGIATVEKGRLDILLEADGKTLENLTTNTAQPPVRQPVVAPTTARVPGTGNGGQPVAPQPSTPATKGELLGFNTTDLSKLHDATSRGGIGKIDILFEKGNQPDPSVSNLLTRMNASGSNISIADLKGIAQVTGLYKDSNGNLITGVDIRTELDNILKQQGLTVQNLKAADVDLFLANKGIQRVGGMGVGVYGGEMPSLQDVQKYQQIVEGVNQRFVAEKKLNYNPNDYSEQVFNPTYPNAEQEYGAALAEERNEFVLGLEGRNATNYNANFRIGNQARGASAWARDVYDNGNATANQPIQGSAVLGSETNNNENIAQIRQNQPLVSNATPQNLANQPSGSNGNGVNGANSNLTPGANNNTIKTPNNNPSPSNFRLGGQMMTSGDVTNTFVRGANISNLNRNIFANEPGGNLTYNDTRFTLYKPWPLEGEMLTTPWGGEDQPTLRVMPNPYGPDGNLKSGGLTKDQDFMSRWNNGLQQGQTTDLYDPKHPGYVLTVDDKGNLTNLKIPDDATQPPGPLEFRALASRPDGSIETDIVKINLDDTATAVPGNGTNPTNIPPPGNGGTTSPPAQPTARTYNVEAGNRLDVNALETNFNNNGVTAPNQNFEQTKGLLPWEGSQNFNQLINGSPENMSHHLDGMAKWANANKGSTDGETSQLANSIIALETFVHGLPNDKEKQAVGFAQSAMKGLIAAGEETDPTKAQDLAKKALETYFNETQKLIPSGATTATKSTSFSGFLGLLTMAGLGTLGGVAGLAQARIGYNFHAGNPRPAIGGRNSWLYANNLPRISAGKDLLAFASPVLFGWNPLFIGLSVGTIAGRVWNQARPNPRDWISI